MESIQLNTALRKVLWIGNGGVSRFLLRNGAVIDKSKHIKYFLDAAYKGHLDIVKIFVENGISIESQDYDKETALFKAVRGSSFSVCKYLNTKGASFKVVNIYGICLIDLIKESKHTLLRNFYIKIFAQLSKERNDESEKHNEKSQIKRRQTKN